MVRESLPSVAPGCVSTLSPLSLTALQVIFCFFLSLTQYTHLPPSVPLLLLFALLRTFFPLSPGSSGVISDRPYLATFPSSDHPVLVCYSGVITPFSLVSQFGFLDSGNGGSEQIIDLPRVRQPGELEDSSLGLSTQVLAWPACSPPLLLTLVPLTFWPPDGKEHLVSLSCPPGLKNQDGVVRRRQLRSRAD